MLKTKRCELRIERCTYVCVGDMDDGKQQEEDGDNDNGKSRVNILYCGGAFPMLEFKIGAGALEREEKCRKRHKSQFQVFLSSE